MVLSNIDEIYKETAAILNIKQEVVVDAMKHIFMSLRRYFKAPDCAGIRFFYFGSISGNLKSINYTIQTKLLPKLRSGKKKYESDFKTIWRLRRLTIDNDERRKYKKRFGSWHWK